MKDLTSKNVIIAVISLAAVGAVILYFSSGVDLTSVGLLSSSASSAGVGSAELSLLTQIQSLKIDASVFTNPLYLKLQDYSVAIPPENVGRANPFLPLPGSVSSAQSSSTSAR